MGWPFLRAEATRLAILDAAYCDIAIKWGRGASRMDIFGPLIVAYLFLGGTGGGALAVLSLLEVAKLGARRA